MAHRQAAVPAAQATIDETQIEEIDRELGEVCDESPINETRQIPMNMTIEQGEVHCLENAEEEDNDDTDNVNASNYFSIEQKKSKFL